MERARALAGSAYTPTEILFRHVSITKFLKIILLIILVIILLIILLIVLLLVLLINHLFGQVMEEDRVLIGVVD